MTRSSHIIYSLAICFSFVITTLPLFAQGVKSDIRQANAQYKAKDYDGAETSFRRILQHNQNNSFARFGLAASQHARGLTDEAMKEYLSLAERSDILPAHRATLYHNMGNAMMAKQQYDQAVDLYKNALLLDPTDDDTRYNYTLAKKLRQKNQQDQNSNSPKDKPDDKQDKQDNPAQQNPNPDGRGEAKPSDQQDAKEKKDKPTKDSRMSRENAEQILDAYKQDEEKTRRRIEEMRQQAGRRNPKNKKQW